MVDFCSTCAPSELRYKNENTNCTMYVARSESEEEDSKTPTYTEAKKMTSPTLQKETSNSKTPLYRLHYINMTSKHFCIH